MKRLAAFVLIFCLLAAAGHARAQTKHIDSLLGELSRATDDTDKIDLNYQLQSALQGYDISKASGFLENGFKLAKGIRSPYFISKYYHLKASLLANESRYDDALAECDSAIALSQELLQRKETTGTIAALCRTDIAQTLITKGLVCAKRFRYNESIRYYLQSIKMFEQIGDGKNIPAIAHIYTSISSNYYELEQYENALEYDRLALSSQTEKEDPDRYIIGNLFVADDFSSLSQFDSSSAYLDKVRPELLRLDKPDLNLRYYYILGGIYRKKRQWQNALKNYERAGESAIKNKDEFQRVNAAEGMAACWLELGDLNKARDLATFVIDESGRLNVPLGKIQGLRLLVRIEDKSGNVKKAFQYQTSLIAIGDSVKKERTQMQMNEIEAEYQSERRQHEITRLMKDGQIQALSIRQQSTVNYVLFGSLFVLLLLGFLLYRNYRQKQALQEQKINDLQKDRQLTTVDAMLKGQEDERSRLARDLHDGLGGILSGVKYSLNSMKDNLTITPAHMTIFDRSLDMLDMAIRELRRVAHNMMPEMLTKFGLDEALKEYSITVSATKLLVVKYQSFGMDARFDNSAEIIIYRIVQELLNNILKHASATEVLVQVIREDTRLNILVEDNGRGFDTAILEQSKGAGWTNIRSRVDYLKGKVDVRSEGGKGSSVTIEFKI